MYLELDGLVWLSMTWLVNSSVSYEYVGASSDTLELKSSAWRPNQQLQRCYLEKILSGSFPSGLFKNLTLLFTTKT